MQKWNSWNPVAKFDIDPTGIPAIFKKTPLKAIRVP